MQTQRITAKNPYLKKLKAKNLKFASSYTNVVEPLKQDKKDEKVQKNRKKKFWKSRKQNNILTTGNNAINTFKKNLRKKDDTNKFMCFNCNKKGHYASILTIPPK